MRYCSGASPINSTRRGKNLDDFNGLSIYQDLMKVEVILTLFEKTGLNDQMPSGMSLVQEVPNRFGTTFDVVERFRKAEMDDSAVLTSPRAKEIRDASRRRHLPITV